jgi:hypothetical protein
MVGSECNKKKSWFILFVLHEACAPVAVKEPIRPFENSSLDPNNESQVCVRTHYDLPTRT